uniref:LOW QUALITY PROTEIN: integrin alpha-E n=1 Tax=Podarcis muralis TaxID=64176 RepID=UPI00109FB1AF|nr:LOW QUALITY PROTEIN: integrin alpha-E [Podarcis muralis]
MTTLQFLLLLLAPDPLKSFNIDTSWRWVSPQVSPSFGHQVFQHTDGRRNWIVAASLGPGDLGKVYKCNPQDNHCEAVSLGENIRKLKKLRSGIAVAQSPEHILACLQHRRRQRRRVTEELNGLCVLLSADFQEKAFINLTDIIETKLLSQRSEERGKRDTHSHKIGGVDTNKFGLAASTVCKEKYSTDGSSEFGCKILESNKNNNRNNGNNYYLEDEEEDESYLRTEIALVLDGSGSIDPPDFERARNFTYSLVKTSYEKCLECVFALVQYGDIIQTEFDLQEERGSAALEKIKAMTQVRNTTWTASAIQHVLDSIFNPNYGSQLNALKIIVVLTDGEIFLDPLDIETVISLTREAGITRYAIGVGEAFEKPKALQELQLIASDPDESHLFRVTNYSALAVLLSMLQEKIIGIEGTEGAILEFDLAQSGFSVHLLQERYILFGAVGAFDWAGGVLLYDMADKTVVFLNESMGTPGARNGYLGYSVGAIDTARGTLVVAGAPRHSIKGKVMVFEGDRLKQILHGEQIGSYFGSELCLLDIDLDGVTDHLLVGAPFFHMQGEEGKVYLYRLDSQKSCIKISPVRALSTVHLMIFSAADLRTEIALVLDGSGSIDPPDFERARNFTYSLVKTSYEKCLECVFALVQYGDIIQTEFDLQEERGSAALEKIKAMTQVRNTTWTASAIQHVLDSIFNPNYGSQLNALKIIVVLTDGEIFLDPLDIETVISLTREAGITRYAIGVGEAFEKPKALQELQLIASDPDESHLFRVTNYSALAVLLSMLQEKIIGIEGTEGAILEFDLAQSGFSVHLLQERYILFGAVGAFDWAGGVLLYDMADKTVVFLNESMGTPGARNGYLGYSVGAIDTARGTLVVAGAPRHSIKGKVMVFEGDRLKQILHGEQIGSYFGSELCLLDIDLDGVTDHLLVGAPFFHMQGEEGKVYLYRLDSQANNFTLQRHLHSQLGSLFSRFGFAMASIGDVDQDGLGDVAIGAPLEDHGSSPNSFGSVYIFNGGKDGLRDPFSQRITAAQTGPPGLMYFGRSVAGGLDFTEDSLPDIIVGSLGSVTLLRSRPILRLKPTMHFTPGRIVYFDGVVTARLCFNRVSPPGTAQSGLPHLLLHYTVDLDVEMEKKRVQFEDQTFSSSSDTSYTGDSCPELQLHILLQIHLSLFQLQYQPCTDDCYSDITLRLTYELMDPDGKVLDYPKPMLDMYQKPEVDFQLPVMEDCGDKSICTPRLSLAVEMEKELVVGSTKELAMKIYLSNSGDNSHMTSLVVQYPSNLHYKNVQEVMSFFELSQRLTGLLYPNLGRLKGLTWYKALSHAPSYFLRCMLYQKGFLGHSGLTEDSCSAPPPMSQQISSSVIHCDAPQPVSVLFSSLRCKVGHPIFKKSTANFSVTWQLDGKKFPTESANFMLNVTNANKNSTALREDHSLGVKYAMNAILTRQLPNVYASLDERSSHSTQFTFNITGNQFGAQLELRIWVPLNIDNRQIASIKNVAGVQNTTVCKTDLGRTDSKDSEGVGYQLVSCTITSEKEDVVVTAELPLANSLQVLENRTDLLVRGEIVFDRNLYVGLNAENYKTEIKVILLKEKVFDFLPFLIGSSVGGLALLLLITTVLYKCGFFKRKYKNRIAEQCDS